MLTHIVSYICTFWNNEGQPYHMGQLEWWPLPLPTRAWIRDNWAKTQGAWRKLYKECNELVEGRPAILKPSKIFRSCSVIGFWRINANSGSILRSYLGFMVIIDSELKETIMVGKPMTLQIQVKNDNISYDKQSYESSTLTVEWIFDDF